MITLHQPDGEPIYIFCHIDVVSKADPRLSPGAGSVIECCGRRAVKETLAQILRLIQGGHS